MFAPWPIGTLITSRPPRMRVFGLSDFTGGEVWVERAGGSTPYEAEGKNASWRCFAHSTGPCRLRCKGRAARGHCLGPAAVWCLWAYTTSHLHKLSSEAQRFAANLGFAIFAPQVASVAHPSRSRRGFQWHGCAVPCSFCFGFCHPGGRSSTSLCLDAYCAP